MLLQKFFNYLFKVMKLFILISILLAFLLFVLFFFNHFNHIDQSFYVEPGTVQGGWNFSDFRSNEIAADISDAYEDSEEYS